MAGYGTTLQTPPEFDPLIRVLMRAAQRRARTLGLRMTYRRHPREDQTEWDMIVDGNGYLIAAWSQWLDRDLPVVAEGFVGIGEGRQARNVAVSLVARWTGWCVGDEECTTISSGGSDEVGWFWPVINVPEPSSPLAPRLIISDSLVARWIVGDLPEEIAIEELHTAIEGLFRAVLGGGKGRWPMLFAKAVAAGHLQTADKTTLHSFNIRYRNRLKHQALALTDAERVHVNALMRDVLGITERLITSIK